MKTVILANGRFPEHKMPLQHLKEANILVCCDGSTQKLIEFGLEPTAIVGDLDSISDDLMAKYADRIFQDKDQETNDLTKAIHWCKNNGLTKVAILAGTGKRDDHTLGNIGLLAGYQRMGMDVRMISDYGTLVPLNRSSRMSSFKNQRVSIFSFNNATRITTHNLMYPIVDKPINEPWMGTLNISLGEWFQVDFEPGPIVLFMGHRE